MTEQGFKLISEMRFDIDSLTFQCENERERELVSNIKDAIKELDSEYDVYYNHRKEEVIDKGGGRYFLSQK